MAIEDIFKALEEQADRDCREILDAAKTQAKAVEADAKAEADRIKSHKLETVESSVRIKAGQITNAARLANKREVSAAKDRGIEQVYEDVLGKLAALRGSKEYESLFKEDVSAFGGYAHDSVMIVAEALKQAGGPDRDKVRDAIEGLKNFVGVSGVFSFSPVDHTGLTLEAFDMLVKKDKPVGKIVLFPG